MIPTNPDFWRKTILAALLLAAAVYFQVTTGAIPGELVTAISSLFIFLLGVSTQPHAPESESQKTRKDGYRD